MPEKKLALNKVSEDLVVVRNLVEDPLDVALNPELSMEYEYFSITRGPTQVFTCVRRDGSTWSFEWGQGGSTLISESTRRLKDRVVSFVQSKGIFLELRGDPKKAFANPLPRESCQIILEDKFGNRQSFYMNGSLQDSMKALLGKAPSFVPAGSANAPKLLAADL